MPDETVRGLENLAIRRTEWSGDLLNAPRQQRRAAAQMRWLAGAVLAAALASFAAIGSTQALSLTLSSATLLILTLLVWRRP